MLNSFLKNHNSIPTYGTVWNFVFGGPSTASKFVKIVTRIHRPVNAAQKLFGWNFQHKYEKIQLLKYFIFEQNINLAM